MGEAAHQGITQCWDLAADVRQEADVFGDGVVADPGEGTFKGFDAGLVEAFLKDGEFFFGEWGEFFVIQHAVDAF